MEDLSKRYYRIGDVASILNIPTSTLRFWEKEFTIIKPVRNQKNTRLYTPKDIETIKMIHFLVKEKGLKKTFIAKKIGVSPQTLNTKIHHGGFDADLAFKVAKILDVNPAIFLAKTYTDRLKIKEK